MPLDFQVIQAPFRFGLAEGTDPHQVPFGTLVTAENACWTRTGTIGKRRGTTAMSMSIVGGGSISAAARLITRGAELALTDGSTLYTSTTSGWVNRGRHPEVGLSWSTAHDNTNGVMSYDVAYLSNGQVVRAWVEGDPTNYLATGNLYYEVVDLTTGSVITAFQILDTGVSYRIRIVTDGTNFAIVWLAGANLKCRIGSTTTTLKTDGQSSVNYASLDACMIGSLWVVAYALGAGGIALVSYNFAPVQQTTATVSGATSTTIQSLSITGASGETLYIAYIEENTSKCMFAAANPSTLAQTVAPTTVETLSATGSPFRSVVTLARSTSTTCLCAYSFYTTATREAPVGVTKTKSITNAGVTTTGQTNHFLRMLSRPFYLNGRPYALMGEWTVADTFVALASGISGSDTWLVDMTVDNSIAPAPVREVGKIACLVGGLWGPGYVCTPALVSSTQAIFPHPYLASAALNFGAWRQAIQLVSATVGTSLPADMWRPVTIGQETYLTAGVLTGYDGLEALPYGWPCSPEFDFLNTQAKNTGGTLQTGTYIYSLVAERHSNAGILHRSPVAQPYTLSNTGAGSGKDTLAITPLSLGYSARDNGIIAIYRTVAGGTILQRLTTEPRYFIFQNAAYAGQPNTIDDTAGDSDISGGSAASPIALSTRPAIYTAGGELEDFQPPSCLTQVYHQNRLWIVTGDGRTVWFSKDVTANPGIAPGFHPTMTLLFDKTLTALASMDEKLIAFASDSFWFVIGNGPSPNGQNGDYQISKVQTDVGCVNPRSVVSTPDGIMFQSARGIYLLTRALELLWIGRQVKDELTSFPNVTSAVLVPSKNEIRFTANNTGATAGIGLIYNYVEKQWTTAKYTVSGIYGAPIADACMFGSVYTFVTPSGVVVQENDASYLDSSVWVPLTLETSWNSAIGPLAYQSVRNFWLEGIANTNHDLTISVGFDNVTSYAQSETFAAGSSVTTIGALEECGISIGTRRKCGAIRFKIQDATPTNPGVNPVGTGQGPSFDMMGIEVGMKQGFRRIPAVQTG